MKRYLGLMAGLLVVTMGYAVDETEKKPANATEAEREFVEEAAKGGMAEVEMGRMAEERASNPEVKRLAAMIRENHEKANAKLKEIAQAKGITVPGTPDKMHQEKHEKMAGLQGEEFDRAYLKAMIKDHEKDIKKFEWASEKLEDQSLKTFAQETLPVLRRHLAETEKLAMKK